KQVLTYITIHETPGLLRKGAARQSRVEEILSKKEKLKQRRNTYMKQLLSYSWMIVAAVLLTFAAGCTTTNAPSENMLAAAGFQQRTADTPKKQEVLKTLPKNQPTLITWKGKNYY